MLYRAIGLMSGSSLDGLDLAYVEFHEKAGKWNFEILQAECYLYDEDWKQSLKNAVDLNARDYLLLHTAYGNYLGNSVQRFISEHQLPYQVQLIASHGHTSFHMPEKKMTAQLGDAAAIAAITGINTVSELRAMDIALGGQGAPIVPMGENLLFPEYGFFLNIGGIANISCRYEGFFTAFDCCPANSLLNALAEKAGLEFDEGGKLASQGRIQTSLLESLDRIDYYAKPYPKSLSNELATLNLWPLLMESGGSIQDLICTCCEHIAGQIAASAQVLIQDLGFDTAHNSKMLCTGGGSLNDYLISRLKHHLAGTGIDPIVPDKKLVKFKEALVMALLGVLRWREENTVLASVTGASRNSIGGCVWIGLEA